MKKILENFSLRNIPDLQTSRLSPALNKKDDDVGSSLKLNI